MNIFIAGICYNLSNADCENYSEEFEKLFQPKLSWTERLAVLKDSVSVEWSPNDEEGNAAIAALNEKEIDGKTLLVSVARPREEGPRRNNNCGGGSRWLR